MESEAPPPSPFPPSAASVSRSPDDTLFFSFFPDFSLSQSPPPAADLHSLHLDILSAVSPYTSSYVWQHEPFSLTPSLSPLPHLHGSLRYGDNLEDEWFAVFLLFRVSNLFPSVNIRCYDSDGEFLLIESAYHLPSWLSPTTAPGRVFIRSGRLRIIPRRALPGSPPPLTSSLRFLAERPEADSVAPEAVQAAIMTRIAEYPSRAVQNMHRVRVRVPVSVARVLQEEPCLISLAVEGFYDRDVDSMKHAAKMERFLWKEEDRQLVRASVTMSRVMYAQLMGQTFRPPGCYPRLPARGEDKEAFAEAELGMKITCGFEMMYQTRKRDGDEGKGRSWEMYLDSLERIGYFQGLLPGSSEYRRLMDRAEDYYRKSSLFSKTSEMLSSPVRRIDEILALPYSMDDFRNVDVPPSDNDSWLYGGEEELNSALLERQKEMDIYMEKREKKKNAKEPSDRSGASASAGGDYDLSDIAKSMQAFVNKMSSYEGAEVPESRDAMDVNIDVDRFMKDMESIMKDHQDGENSFDDEVSRGSSELDFDESEEESANEDEKDAFMDCYSDALDQELKSSTLSRSFVRANDQPSSKPNEGNEDGTTTTAQEKDEDFSPVDVDVNLVKSFLESFTSQEGLPGPASNLLGLMGLQLPGENSNKKK
ncbi:hypothetical protein MLD38_028495 [Melastoma candidum]|uniref:Uncharacterized protein n=1 Tax=Melastoma candidum TaxID=119954 RepID=A0ACB9N0W3_9MYRT|nr:hypothetical protein MLD38_028495 [Melastoma candidum]